MRIRVPVILTCLLAVVLAAMPVRQAKADGVSFDVFYNNLADDGDWYNTPEYGYIWHPTVADKSDKWRPYTDGYWAQTDDGWTWVSYENFGWATYHYGRWTRLKDIGWAWVPGYDWGPGWVSWRTNEDHVGWAPLPPRADQGVEEGRPVERRREVAVDYNTVEPADYGPDVDTQYDIGPENYCFVETRHFGAPVLAEVILPPQQNYVIIERTVNVTNIYRPPGGPVGPGGGFVVFNRGPDYNFINSRCERPIQVLRIERHEDVVYLNNGIHGGGNANQVRGGVFSVAAPSIRREQVNFTQVKPVRVKQTIERTEVVHGWSNSGADPATVQRLRENFKQQAQQATPPPREPNPPRPQQLLRAKEEANQPPAPAANNNPPPPANANNGKPPLSPEEKAARREARQKANAPGAPTPAPGQPPVAPAPDRGPKPNKGPVAPAPGNPPGANSQPLTPEEKAARRAQHQQAKAQPDQQPPAGQPPQPANNPPAPNPDKEARKAQRQQEKAQQGQQPPAQPDAPNPDKEARKAQRQQAQSQPQPQAQPPAPNPEKEARKAQRQQEQQQAQPSQTQPPAPNPEKEARKAQRQQEQQQAQPSHAPQQANTPQAKGDDDKKKKKDQPNQ